MLRGESGAQRPAILEHPHDSPRRQSPIRKSCYQTRNDPSPGVVRTTIGRMAARASTPPPRRRWKPPTERPPRILIVRLSAIGDVVHALPVARAIRLRWPDAHIGWAVEDRAADLLTMSPDVDACHVFRRRPMANALRRGTLISAGTMARRFVRNMRSAAYDVALDLQGNLKSGMVMRSSGAQRRFGWDRSIAKEANQIFAHHHVRPTPNVKHKALRNLSMLSHVLGEPIDYHQPHLTPSEQHEQEARSLMAALPLRCTAHVILHPGTSGFGSFKRWPNDRWAALARRLHREGYDVLLSHTKAERTLIEAIESGAPHSIPMAPPSIGALAVLARGASLFVASDTGPLHLAALMNAPVLGLYGPKDPGVYGPFGSDKEGAFNLLPTQVQSDVACRPCRLRVCGNPICMNTLSPDSVFEHCLKILSTESPSRANGSSMPTPLHLS